MSSTRPVESVDAGHARPSPIMQTIGAATILDFPRIPELAGSPSPSRVMFMQSDMFCIHSR